MVHVWLTVGLQGSGKSTWAKKFAKETGAVRLEMDCYRQMMGWHAGSPEWTPEREKLSFQAMLDNLVFLVKNGHKVVLSNTHLNRNWASQYKTALQHYDVTWHVKDFTDVPIEECIRRDSGREGLCRVGEAVIKKAHKGFQRSQKTGLVVTEPWLNEPLFEIRKYEGSPGKPKALLVDFDGTLALMDGRGPYEFWRVDEDKICKPVHMAVKMARAYGYKVIGCSGRDEGLAKEKTKLWMAKNAVVLDGLVMRKAGDRRRDDVVKHDLFWEFIAPHYDVEWVMDDRQRVVDVWRAMGIQCFQVQTGDF